MFSETSDIFKIRRGSSQKFEGVQKINISTALIFTDEESKALFSSFSNPLPKKTSVTPQQFLRHSTLRRQVLTRTCRCTVQCKHNSQTKHYVLTLSNDLDFSVQRGCSLDKALNFQNPSVPNMLLVQYVIQHL